MISSIALPKKTDKHIELFLITANLIKTVAHYQTKIEKSRQQLTLIAKSNNKKVSTIKKADKFLARQNKLSEIAKELKDRMIGQMATGAVFKELETQFAEEVELLNWMHFEVAKSYAAFIQQNFEARVISLMRPIAA